MIQPEAAWNRLIEVEAGVGEHIALIGPKIPIHPAFADAVTDAEYDADRLRLLEAVRDTKNFGFSAHRLTFTALAPGETDVELVIRRADASPASEPDSEPRARYRIRVSR
ncbi:MAG: hypothetical protein KDC98_26260 [Planctomycetes bacterium]|nr:hypothetical protein [Planctomycetota bacterium]